MGEIRRHIHFTLPVRRKQEFTLLLEQHGLERQQILERFVEHAMQQLEAGRHPITGSELTAPDAA